MQVIITCYGSSLILNDCKKYWKSGNFRANFIFGNSVKRHICDAKNSRLWHYLHISVNWHFARILYSRSFAYAKFSENKTLAKISELTVSHDNSYVQITSI